MNAAEKIKRSWWVLISFIILINGLGLMYVGHRQNNYNWSLEGIIYEIPWIFCICYVDFDPLYDPFFVLAMIFMLISIIRSFWIALKLADVYENEDKYLIQNTSLNAQNKMKSNDNFSTTMGCCVCLVAIFVIFLILTI